MTGNADKANEMAGSNPPVLVELHDARLSPEGMGVLPGSKIEIGFTDVVTYHTVKEQAYALFLRPANLYLTGCTEARLLGRMSDDSTVSDAQAFLGEQEVDITQYLTEGPIAAVFLTFTCGAKIAVLATGGHLVLGPPRRRLSDWIGPLISNPASSSEHSGRQ